VSRWTLASKLTLKCIIAKPLSYSPTHYKLAIKTDLEALTFEGKVEIESVASLISLNEAFADLSVPRAYQIP
jgi:hypothetical protein